MVVDVPELVLRIKGLSVYRGIRERSVVKAIERLFNSLDEGPDDFTDAYCGFFSILCERGSSDRLAEYITRAALFDDNCFTRAAAAGKTAELPENVVEAVKNDCSTIKLISMIKPDDVIKCCPWKNELEGIEKFLPKWECGEPVSEFQEADIISALEEFHKSCGCGMYARYKAFVWRQGKIRPVTHPDRIKLDDLKGYEYQRKLVIENTEAFLDGKTCNNCLLYGDKGTGKSSTVKAVGNYFFNRGLRVVEIPKERLMDFPLLIEEIAAQPMKFVIFIDDLSFMQQDENYASLKAVLEGGLAAKPDNALIYATSNRRHLIKESFADRDADDVNRRDNMEESLSLSDRFGLSVPFTAPGKEKYLEIVVALAQQYNIVREKEELCAGAERFALERGGRSPRCAKQYIESLFNKLS